MRDAGVHRMQPALPCMTSLCYFCQLSVPAGRTQMHELGPGQQIKAMVKRIDNSAWAAFKNMVA